MGVWLCVWMSQRLEKDVRSPGTVSPGLTSAMWVLGVKNLGPLEEQPVLPTTDSVLQLSLLVL